jgi:sugar lactone lactonase YvrE
MGKGIGLAAAAAVLWTSGASAADWKVETLVSGSAFHGVHGIRLGPDGDLYAGSVLGQSLWAVNRKTGKARVVVPPPEGMADDLGFGPGGQLVWTAIGQGIVYTRRGAGPVEVLAKDLPSINSIIFSRDGKRIYAAQVFGGDDLFELDPAGKAPPRRIREKLGGFNSFAQGPDGWLYGPVWFKGQIAKVNPESGEMVVVAEGLKTPAAAKFDRAGALYALDTAVGQLLAIDVKTGAKRLVAQLKPSLDNFEIAADDHAYVTNMADNGVQDVDLKTGKVRQVIKGELCFPIDIAVASDGAKETLYVADGFAFRKVDVASRKVSELGRSYAQDTHVAGPNGVGVGQAHVLLSGGGGVTVWDRATGQFLTGYRDLQGASDPIELADGSIVVVERARGRVSRLANGVRATVAEGLAAPSSLAEGPNGSVYVAELGANRVLRIDLATSAKTALAEGLAQPRAVAVAPDGKVVVLEIGAKQVTSIDPATGTKAVLARNLPVGWITKPLPTAGGVAVGPSGTIYVSSDVENSILRLTPP